MSFERNDVLKTKLEEGKINLDFNESARILRIINEAPTECEWEKIYYSLSKQVLEDNAPKHTGCLKYTPVNVKLNQLCKLFKEQKALECGIGVSYEYSGYRKGIDKYSYREK